MAGVFQAATDEDSRDGCRCSSAYGCKTMRATEDNQNQAEGVPEPAVAAPRGYDHKNSEPPRCAPAVDATHQPVVVGLNLVPERLCDSHTHSSSAGCGTEIQRGRGRDFGSPITSAAQWRLNCRSSK